MPLYTRPFRLGGAACLNFFRKSQKVFVMTRVPVYPRSPETVSAFLARLEREGFADSQSPTARKVLWRYRMRQYRFSGPKILQRRK